MNDLSSLVFPSSLTTIGPNAFGTGNNNGHLNTLIFEGAYPSMGGGAFTGLRITTVLIGEDGGSTPNTGEFDSRPANIFYFSLSGSVLASSVSSKTTGAVNCSTMPADLITEIGMAAFSDCSSMTSFVCPPGLLLIDDHAFVGCRGLSSVTLSETVTTIGSSAFNGCSSLTSVTIPASVTLIAASAFENCINLATVIYQGTPTVDPSAFTNCSPLQALIYADPLTKTQISGITGDLSGALDCSTVTTVLEIMPGAFLGQNGLTSLTLPPNLQLIDASGFAGCTGLTSVTIPASVTNIGPHAFAGCSNLATVTYAGTMPTFDPSAFTGCIYTLSLNLVSSITSCTVSAAFRITMSFPDTDILSSTVAACSFDLSGLLFDETVINAGAVSYQGDIGGSYTFVYDASCYPVSLSLNATSAIGSVSMPVTVPGAAAPYPTGLAFNAANNQLSWTASDTQATPVYVIYDTVARAAVDGSTFTTTDLSCYLWDLSINQAGTYALDVCALGPHGLILPTGNTPVSVTVVTAITNLAFDDASGILSWTGVNNVFPEYIVDNSGSLVADLSDGSTSVALENYNTVRPLIVGPSTLNLTVGGQTSSLSITGNPYLNRMSVPDLSMNTDGVTLVLTANDALTNWFNVYDLSGGLLVGSSARVDNGPTYFILPTGTYYQLCATAAVSHAPFWPYSESEQTSNTFGTAASIINVDFTLIPVASVDMGSCMTSAVASLNPATSDTFAADFKAFLQAAATPAPGASGSALSSSGVVVPGLVASQLLSGSADLAGSAVYAAAIPPIPNPTNPPVFASAAIPSNAVLYCPTNTPVTGPDGLVTYTSVPLLIDGIPQLLTDLGGFQASMIIGDLSGGIYLQNGDGSYVFGDISSSNTYGAGSLLPWGLKTMKFSGTGSLGFTPVFAVSSSNILTGISLTSTDVSGILDLTSHNDTSTITEISGSVFSGLSLMTGIVLPASLLRVGASAFSNCSKLTDVSFGGFETRLGAGVFSDCSSLGHLTIPATTRNIGSGAFSGCTALSYVFFLDPSSQTMTIGGSLFSSGNRSTAYYIWSPTNTGLPSNIGTTTKAVNTMPSGFNVFSSGSVNGELSWSAPSGLVAPTGYNIYTVSSTDRTKIYTTRSLSYMPSDTITSATIYGVTAIYADYPESDIITGSLPTAPGGGGSSGGGSSGGGSSGGGSSGGGSSGGGSSGGGSSGGGSSGGGSSGGGRITCFLKPAPVLTPTGYKAIGSLQVGDLVRTASGQDVPIQKISIQRVSPSAAVNPYIIPKGQFGAKKLLYISPNHKLMVGGTMVRSSDPSLGLKQKTMTTDFDYYNLELPAWENMVVAGVTVESLAPIKRMTVTRAQFIEMLVASYGSKMTPTILAKIKSTVRFLDNGMVDIQTMHKHI